MQGLLNVMRLQAQMASGARATVRVGVVTSYNPADYCAKVTLQPDGQETGWLPVTSPWIGNGWGMFCPPSPGDMVEVQFQEGEIEAGFIVGRFFNDSERPLPVQSGEFWLVHKSGSLLKFHNDGSVELTAIGTLTSVAPQWNHTGPMHITGDVTIAGKETVSDLITGQNGITVTGSGTTATITGNLVTTGTITNNGKNVGSTHAHSGVQTGAGNTGVPI